MSRSLRALLPLLAALLVVSPAHALDKNATMFAVQVGPGSGWFVNPVTSPSDHYLGTSSDFGPQTFLTAELWHAFTSDYAFTISGGVAVSHELEQPGHGAPATAENLQIDTKAHVLRIGGDRLVKVSKRGTLFYGPGFQYWAGYGRYRNVYASNVTTQTPTTHLIGINGRFGGIMEITPALGIVGHIGTTLSYGTAQDSGMRTTRWVNAYEGQWGISYTFGEE